MAHTWLTAREVSQRIGLSLRETRLLFDPSHPQHIPCVVILTRPSDKFPEGRPRYRVRSTALDAWLDQHEFDILQAREAWVSEQEAKAEQAIDYDPAEDSDSEVGGFHEPETIDAAERGEL